MTEIKKQTLSDRVKNLESVVLTNRKYINDLNSLLFDVRQDLRKLKGN